jgi:hypothetical protein
MTRAWRHATGLVAIALPALLASGPAAATPISSPSFKIINSALTGGGTTAGAPILTSPSFLVTGASVGQGQTPGLVISSGLLHYMGVWATVAALDGDTVPTEADNCDFTPNLPQLDSNSNGIGDACEGPCNDLIDNDGDTLFDYPDDPGCRNPFAPSFEDPECDDMVDNDGDGLVDLGDPGCNVAWKNLEDPQCDDGLDNDSDGFFDLADPQCAGPADNFEAPTCGIGPELIVVMPALGLVHRRRERRRPRRAEGGSSC